MKKFFAAIAAAWLIATPVYAQECQPIEKYVATAEDKNIPVKVMEGPEAKAFESVVQKTFTDYALEPTTTKIYFFEVGPNTWVMEVDAQGCVVDISQAPTALVQALIGKMTAENIPTS